MDKSIYVSIIALELSIRAEEFSSEEVADAYLQCARFERVVASTIVRVKSYFMNQWKSTV